MTEEQKNQNTNDGNGGAPVKEGAAATLVPRTGDAFSKIVESVSGGITSTANGFGKAGVSAVDAVAAVVQQAVREAVEGSTDLAWGAKAIVVGVLRGTGEKADVALTTLSRTARSVIRHAAGMRGDLAASVKGLVLGAIASAKNSAVSRDHAATAAAKGALEGAEDAGSVAVEKVRDALKQSIGGVKVAPWHSTTE